MEKKAILVVDAAEVPRKSLNSILTPRYTVHLASSAAEAVRILNGEDVHVVLLDIVLPAGNQGCDGMALLRCIRQLNDHIPVIIVTAQSDHRAVVEAMKAGANEYMLKPYDEASLLSVIKQGIQRKEYFDQAHQGKVNTKTREKFDEIVGTTKPMQEIYDQIEVLADKSAPVLIYGESGTGKELIAKAIHNRSKRNCNRFEAISCVNIPEELLESELFGHERGAFTGAEAQRKGYLELAHGGTLFFDEIGEATPPIQAKLLRILEEHEFKRVGGMDDIKVDARLIAATNKNLEEAVAEGQFRDDLYYRINVVTITAPPLRERREDIPLLAKHFLTKYSDEADREIKGITPEAISVLVDYAWPGNVRELEHVIRRAVVFAKDDYLSLFDLVSGRGQTAFTSHQIHSINQLEKNVFSGEMSLDEAIAFLEREVIIKALRQSDGIQTQAAGIVQTTRRTLKYKMDTLGINKAEYLKGGDYGPKT